MKTTHSTRVNPAGMSRSSGFRALGLLLGCALAGASVAQSDEKIVVDGSTGVAPLVTSLAKAYRERNPAVAVEIGKGLGTKARIKALAQGSIDIAMASHGLVADELIRQGMAVHEIAKVAVVFAVNAAVPATGLGDQQICAIYERRLVNWNELGGPDLAVAPRTRPDTEVDAEIARQRVACLARLQMPDGVRVMPKSGDMARELAATPGAIGMTTMTVVEQSKGKISAVALNGVAPSPDNVRSGAYRLTRDSFLVVKAAPTPAVASFLDFIRSPEGKRVISANGAVPLD